MGLFFHRCSTLHLPLLNFMRFPPTHFFSLSRSLWMEAWPSGVSTTPSSFLVAIPVSVMLLKRPGDKGEERRLFRDWSGRLRPALLPHRLSCNPLKLRVKTWWYWNQRWFYHYLLLGQALRFSFQNDACFFTFVTCILNYFLFDSWREDFNPWEKNTGSNPLSCWTSLAVVLLSSMAFFQGFAYTL